MVQIINPESALKILNKVLLVRSRRDGRLGAIISRNGDVAVLRMENLNRNLEVNIETLCSGFTFIFSKKEMVICWYCAKFRRNEYPLLTDDFSIYTTMDLMMEDLGQFFPWPNLLHEEVFEHLKNFSEAINKVETCNNQQTISA